jgi:hypothetical protein
VVEQCSPFARIVVTGSGLVTLLNSFRTARVNSFALWDAVTYVSLGSTPSRSTSEVMAARLLDKYAVHWPQPVRDAITPKVLVDAFEPSAFGGLTSARPALMAYALGCMGRASSGTADAVLSAAVGAVFSKLKTSVRDTLSALVSLSHIERRALRDVVAGYYTRWELKAIQDGKGLLHFKNWAYEEPPSSVQHVKADLPLSLDKAVISARPEKLAALIGCLREKSVGEEKDGDVVHLQPPYAALLRSWIRPNGVLAISVHDDRIDLDYATRSNLVLISEERQVVSEEGLWGEVAEAFWASMISNGIGIREVIETASGKQEINVRVPVSPEEFERVPAFARLNDMLNAKFLEATEARKNEADKEKQKQIQVPPKPLLYKLLHDAVAAEGVDNSSGASSFQEKLGKQLILAFRHFHAHAWGDAPALVRHGLTSAVVAEAIDAVVAVLADGRSRHFTVDPAKPEQLTTWRRRGEAARGEAATAR